MPGMNIAQMFAQGQGNEFSGNYNNYQPSLRPMQGNPLASGVQQGNPKGSATLGGIDEAFSKLGSQDNNAQRLSSAGESSGVKFKHDDAGHATGSSAFDTLDGYMKKAGLNSFQTQFFSRMIESGMPEVMIGAAVKTAGDRFGAEVHAELQDGYEKLANATVGKAILQGLFGVGRKMLGTGAKQGVKAVGKGAFGQGGVVAPTAASGLRGAGQAAVRGTTTAAKNVGSSMANATRNAGSSMANATRNAGSSMANATRNAGSSMANATRKVVGNPTMTRAIPDTGGFASTVAGNTFKAKPTGGYRALQGLGDYFGSGALQTAGRDGLRKGLNQYAGGLSQQMGSKATTGGIFGALDPDNTYMGGDQNAFGNIAGGMAMGLFGGPAMTRAMRRGAATGAMGSISDELGFTDNAAQLGRYGGMLAPRSLNRIPGVSGAVARVGTGEAKMLPSIARKLGLQEAGKATTNRGLAQALVKTPLSTGYRQTGKGNLGVFDAMDPANQAFRGAGAALRKGKSMLANSGPGTAAALSTAGILAPAAGAALYKGNQTMNRLASQADQTMGGAANALADAHQQVSDLISSTDSQVQEALKPENLAEVGKHLANDEGIQEQVNGLAGGFFGQFMENAGTGVMGAVENFLGPEAASFLQENWPLLLAGAAGIGGGALMGGGAGALLGGVAAPLAMMMAQESGMFSGGTTAPSEQKTRSPVTAPGSNVATEGPSGIRNELTENQMLQAPTTPANLPPMDYSYDVPRLTTGSDANQRQFMNRNALNAVVG